MFNQSESATILDAEAIAEYCINLGREHGISKESCFFGRVSLLRSKQIDESIDDNTSNKFVYTGITLRVLEQISQAISQNESLLLVGETGTGKTTAVQEIAKLIRKKLHVFNMN